SLQRCGAVILCPGSGRRIAVRLEVEVTPWDDRLSDRPQHAQGRGEVPSFGLLTLKRIEQPRECDPEEDERVAESQRAVSPSVRTRLWMHGRVCAAQAGRPLRGPQRRSEVERRG